MAYPVLGHERGAHADVRIKNLPGDVFLAYVLLLAVFGALLADYPDQIRAHRLKVAGVGRMNR